MIDHSSSIHISYTKIGSRTIAYCFAHIIFYSHKKITRKETERFFQTAYASIILIYNIPKMVRKSETSPAVRAASSKAATSSEEEEMVVAVGNNKAFLEMLAKQNKQILSALDTQNKLLKTIQDRKAAATTGAGRDAVPSDDEDIDDIIEAFSKSTTTPAEKVVVEEVLVIKEEPQKPKVPTTFGPWSFGGSADAFKLRQRVVKTFNPSMVTDKSIIPLTNAELLASKDALFGNICCEEQLTGDSFGKHWQRMRNLDKHGKPIAPKWSYDGKPSVRSLLPQIEINGKKEIRLNTGIYYLTVQYNNEEDMWGVECGVIIGEIAFDNRGHVLAQGSDWDKLLKGGVIAAGDKPTKWFSTKVSSSPWIDGDRLKFKIDTNDNTISYHNVSSGEKETFPNVLQYTNNRTNRESLQVFAYCGAKNLKEFPTSSAENNRLSIIDSKKEW